jgi:NAD dependent epimerase/dehydratase family enzyme
MPEFGVKLAFGEMGEALLLSSQKVMPGVLEQFKWPTLEAALRHLLNADKRG